MSERVQGVVTQQGTEISDVVNRVADRYSFPPRLLVACGIMESNLDEHSERRAAWPDVSAGLFHQAVKWAAGYSLGDGSARPANVAAVFQTLKTDLERAADIAGRQLGHWWAQEGDGLEALSRYNAPTRAWAANPNRANILRGWEASARYVVPEEVPMAEHSYQFGFAEVADALGAAVVGEPVTDEFPIGAGPDSGAGGTLQITTRGVMVYASGAGPRFLASQGA